MPVKCLAPGDAQPAGYQSEMPTPEDPLLTSSDLARWASTQLAPHIEGVAEWRMLEDWAQAELYRE